MTHAFLGTVCAVFHHAGQNARRDVWILRGGVFVEVRFAVAVRVGGGAADRGVGLAGPLERAPVGEESGIEADFTGESGLRDREIAAADRHRRGRVHRIAPRAGVVSPLVGVQCLAGKFVIEHQVPPRARRRRGHDQARERDQGEEEEFHGEIFSRVSFWLRRRWLRRRSSCRSADAGQTRRPRRPSASRMFRHTGRRPCIPFAGG